MLEDEKSLGIIFLPYNMCTPFQTIEISDLNFRFPSIFRGQVLSVLSALTVLWMDSLLFLPCEFVCLCLKDLRETCLTALQLFSLCTLDGFCIRCSEGLWETRLNEEPITAADKEFIWVFPLIRPLHPQNRPVCFVELKCRGFGFVLVFSLVFWGL